jgi:hypothetical protein
MMEDKAIVMLNGRSAILVTIFPCIADWKGITQCLCTSNIRIVGGNLILSVSFPV